MSRLIDYARVSRVGGRDGDSFISPDVQHERNARYAAENGHTIVGSETDLDVSGGTMQRPAFERAMRAIEAGRADGIIVARLDRFSRTLDGALASVRRLDAAGAVLVSCADQLDASTPTGKAMFRMLLVIAELQRDMIAASWLDARSKAAERGVYLSTHVPLGYVRGPGGQLAIDPETGPLVVAAFESAAAGRSLVEIGEPLNFTRQGARSLLANRAYLGELHSGQLVRAGAHEPLVSRELWERANVARRVARVPRGPGHLLSGIARCATCRHALSANGRQYKCANVRCTRRAAIKAETIESNMRALYAMFVASPAAVDAERVGELRAALDAAESELRAFVTVMRAGEPGFREGVDGRQSVVAECRRQLAAVAAPEIVALDADEPVADQRRKVSQAVVAVFVRPGTGSVADRTRVVWQGTVVELPSRGGSHGEITTLPPFPFGDAPTLSLVPDRMTA